MKTVNTSIFRSLERRATEKLCALVPPGIGTKNITFFGLLSSFGVCVSYYLCRKSFSFLFLASFFIIMEWIFDCLDGAIGRVRDEGFIRWGYYMDHLFDYFFLACVVFGLYFLFPGSSVQILLLFLISSSYMVAFFLFYNVGNKSEFKISFWGFSPIEFRLSVIAFNILFYFNTRLIKTFVAKYFIFLNLALLLFLIVIIYFQQKELDREDRRLGATSGDFY